MEIPEGGRSDGGYCGFPSIHLVNYGLKKVN